MEISKYELFNKYEEAIKDIKLAIKPVCGGISLDLAIEALEKQIPKKPIEIECEWVCPNCKSTLNDSKKYCHWCGQKLSY